MQQSSGKRERRKHPRIFIDLPLGYQAGDDPCLKGGVAVNASEGGLLFESIRTIPVGTKLNVSVLFLKRYELADFKLAAEIAWKEPLFKEEWEGYQYGLSIVRLEDEDHRKLIKILHGQFGLHAIDMFSDEKREVEGLRKDAVQIPRYKVLVVDDEEDVRKLLVNLLSKRGHQCLQAMDGADALGKAITIGFDVVITDIVMPKMSGIALAKELLKRNPNLPIMAMTGHNSEFATVTAMASGAREFIKKPFSLTEFNTRFDKMMSDHEIRWQRVNEQQESIR